MVRKHKLEFSVRCEVNWAGYLNVEFNCLDHNFLCFWMEGGDNIHGDCSLEFYSVYDLDGKSVSEGCIGCLTYFIIIADTIIVLLVLNLLE